MPYIVETTQSCGYCTHCGYGGDRVASCLHRKTHRAAVATLDEAREAAKTTIIDGPWRYGVDKFILATYHLPEYGGTVGPLPDGTVIEVRWRSWPDLQADAGHEHRLPLSDANVLSLFNTGHYVGAASTR